MCQPASQPSRETLSTNLVWKHSASEPASLQVCQRNHSNCQDFYTKIPTPENARQIPVAETSFQHSEADQLTKTKDQQSLVQQPFPPPVEGSVVRSMCYPKFLSLCQACPCHGRQDLAYHAVRVKLWASSQTYQHRPAKKTRKL